MKFAIAILISVVGLGLAISISNNAEARSLSNSELEKITGAADCCASTVSVACAGGGTIFCVEGEVAECPETSKVSIQNSYRNCTGSGTKHCNNLNSIFCYTLYEVTTLFSWEDSLCDDDGDWGCYPIPPPETGLDCEDCQQGAALLTHWNTDHSCT